MNEFIFEIEELQIKSVLRRAQLLFEIVSFDVLRCDFCDAWKLR